MPEIWLKYGYTDVVLDIRYENLLKNYQTSESQNFSNEEIGKIENIKLVDNMIIFAFSSSSESVIILDRINKIALKKNIKVYFGTPSYLKDIIKKKLQSTNIDEKKDSSTKKVMTDESSNEYNYQNDVNNNIINNLYNINGSDEFNKFSQILFLSKVTYDPLFGFGGSITNLLKNYENDKMGEAFNARKNNIPSPGSITYPLKIALEYASKWDENLSNCNTNNNIDCPNRILKKIESIEIVTDYSGNSRVYYGDLNNNLQSGINDFVRDTKIETDFTRSLIVNAGHEVDNHVTLNESLDSMWNSIHAVRGHGTIILIAENKLGLGDGALKMFIEGRLSVDQQMRLDTNKKYVRGMEHLLFIDEFKNKVELGLLSSLPKFFSSKLGFTSFKNMKEIIEHLLERNGKSHKISVLSDPDRLLLTKQISEASTEF